MRVLALVLASLVFSGYGRRLPMASSKEVDETSNPSASLASLLMSFNQAAGPHHMPRALTSGFTSRNHVMQDVDPMSTPPVTTADLLDMPTSPQDSLPPPPASIADLTDMPQSPLFGGYRELVAMDMFPVYPSLEKIEGGGTIRTYKMPNWANKCQYLLTTDGRPMKAEANLWIGPERTVHTLKVHMEDGALTPYQATLTFKKLGQVFKVSTVGSAEFPFMLGVYVPSPERSEELQMNTENIWKNALPEQKKKVQGGSVEGGKGDVKYWDIPPNVQSVQLLSWSKDVGKKSFKILIEVLQGPSTVKQRMFLQCGGGTQPYHSVIQTPGHGSLLQITNNKFLEDGLVEVAIVPYEVTPEEPEIGDGQEGLFLGR